ncbi:ribulose-5-phosphate 3-epimerase [Lentzea atacamensis]|uniref:Ribulose-5-phosphate 3-epimerase n=1 Tax=Lentzea atacamensis TaxID=531938 RepID=A0ABX9DYW2_9PSEU|nr:thiamine phosphate synthase [Lentzea atacamensis]RAS59420.1 ribulose-5-phosphate 3-epimerase [Lentzea atacamensis]
MPWSADTFPAQGLGVEVSLWSADLGALSTEVERLGPLADVFHLDASDTRMVPDALLFPDLLAAIRPHTRIPIHVHLMAERATHLTEAFVRAGADLITLHSTADDLDEALDTARELGAATGLALTLDTPVEVLSDYADNTDAVLMVGTPLGTKGTGMDPAAPARIRAARALLAAAGRAEIPVIADGGIRADTVPALAAAGAHAVVAGSLLLGADDPATATAWLRTHAPMSPSMDQS